MYLILIYVIKVFVFKNEFIMFFEYIIIIFMWIYIIINN